MTTDFDFHSIVGFRLQSGSAAANGFYHEELAAHLGQPAQGVPMVELNWRDSWLPRRPGPGYRLQVHKRLARWYYRIAVNRDSATIDCAGNRTSIPMAWHMLVEPAMRYLASGRDAIMLHGASIVLDGRCLVFTGTGGTGKTTTSSLLLRHGPEWELHSDDFVFLRPDGTSRALGTRAHAYLDLLKWLPELRSRLTARERARLAVFGWLRRLSGNRIRWPMRLSLDRLWPGRALSMQARLGAVVMLKTRGGEQVALRRITPDHEVIQELLDMNFFEARYFRSLTRAYLGAQQAEAEMAIWRQQEKQVLTETLQRVPVYRLNLPVGLQSDGGRVQGLLDQLAAAVTGDAGVAG